MTTLSQIVNGFRDSGITGSGKRAAYAMLSGNTSTTWHGYALYDENFKPVINLGGISNQENNYGPAPIVNLVSSTYAYGSNSFFDGTSGNTSALASSNDTTNYLNGTNNAGEFGHAGIDIYSDGTWGRQQRTCGSTYGQNKTYLNRCAIVSDHSDKRTAYILYGSSIIAVDRLHGGYPFSKQGTAAFVVSSLNGSMNGSGAYNNVRKELTILSYNGVGSYNVITYTGVDFDAYPSPAAALAAGGVARVNSTVTIPSWDVSDTESYYNPKIVVADNGDMWIAVQYAASNYRLYKATRSGTTTVTAVVQQSFSLSTQYGSASGVAFGQRSITSRNGQTVCLFGNYYYYGAGLSAFMIDKTNNVFTGYQNTTSGAGLQPLPFKDDGWAFWFAGNVYASNYAGGYIDRIYERQTTGNFAITGQTVLMPYFTGPNTTNYPGFTQVTDYNLLVPNSYGLK